MSRLGNACSAFSQILFNGDKAQALLHALTGATPAALGKPEPTEEKPIEKRPAEKAAAASPPSPVRAARDDAIYTLVLLQREGRLIDFLKEDINAYDDADIGIAVREIHAKCGKALEKHFAIEPVRRESEGETIEVPPGFDASEIQLTGNVRGEPPMRGALRHRGWRVTKVDLPERTGDVNTKVICPCEVEI